jgi:hypothetical protein
MTKNAIELVRPVRHQRPRGFCLDWSARGDQKIAWVAITAFVGNDETLPAAWWHS